MRGFILLWECMGSCRVLRACNKIVLRLYNSLRPTCWALVSVDMAAWHHNHRRWSVIGVFAMRDGSYSLEPAILVHS